MAIRARYDAKEDRMLLTFEPKDGERRSFWVTRRQWLGLYNALGPLAPEKLQPKQPAPRPQPLAASVTNGVVRAESIKLQRNDHGVSIAFEGRSEPVRLELSGDTLEQLKQMLDQQADRAGWDAHAALQRIQAAAAANAAVRKAAVKG